VGVVTMLQFVEYHADAVPDDNLGLARCLFLYIPLLLFAFGWLIGGITAAVEGWSLLQGFLHMTGTLCGLTNPIDDEVIQTKIGMFVESACACLNLGFVALVLQVVAKHPSFQIAMVNIEGTYAEIRSSRRSEIASECIKEFDDQPMLGGQLEAGKREAENHISMLKVEASAACLENFQEHMDKVSKYVKDLEQQVAVLMQERDHLASTALEKDPPPPTNIIVKAFDEQPPLNAPHDAETER